MALSDLIDADVTAVILSTSDFAETVTREIAGDPTDTQSLTVLISAQATEKTAARGRAQVHGVEMHIDDAVTIDLTDAIIWNAERYKVTDVEKERSGMIRVSLQRVESERTEARVGRNLR